MKELILAYQGEMTLKGLNRGKFEARLAKHPLPAGSRWASLRSIRPRAPFSSSRRKTTSTWTRRSAAFPKLCSAS